MQRHVVSWHGSVPNFKTIGVLSVLSCDYPATLSANWIINRCGIGPWAASVRVWQMTSG